MKVDTVFISLRARDFGALSGWWAQLLNRSCDREPQPNCREWTLADAVLFQVLDDAAGAGSGTVTLRVDDLDRELPRLRQAGIAVPEPERVEGFQTLRYSHFTDPEGNEVGLFDGE